MTTATRKKTTNKLPLLQKGDRIRGTSPQGLQHAGTFEGFSSKDLILCKEGERTIALFPTSVERVAEPVTFADTYEAEGQAIAQSFQAGDSESPMQSLSALLPTVEASIATHAQTETAVAITCLETLAAEIEAIFAEAEEAEATMLNAGRAAFTRSLALGEKLLTAKAEPEIGGYGKWLPWLEQRGIPERKAQRAIRLHTHRQLLEQSDAVTELTLTEALDLVSKKALKPAVETPIAAQTPEAIEQQFSLIGDHATPTLPELMLLYTQLGAVKPWKKGFAVERDDMGAPFPLAFQNRASAWRRWQEEWRGFAVSHPLPVMETPVDALPAIPEKTSALEDEKRASDSYHYSQIDPKPVWFQVSGEWVEGQAIAANGHGFFRIAWGEERESDIPGGRVWWTKPDLEVAAAIDAHLEAQGFERHQPSDETQALDPCFAQANQRGSGHDNPYDSEVTRLQFEGATALVKAAIVQSKLSLVEVTKVLLSLANEDEIEAIADLFDKEVDDDI